MPQLFEKSQFISEPPWPDQSKHCLRSEKSLHAEVYKVTGIQRLVYSILKVLLLLTAQLNNATIMGFKKVGGLPCRSSWRDFQFYFLRSDEETR